MHSANRESKNILKNIDKEIIKIALNSPISKLTPLALIPISYYSLPNYVQLEATTKCNLNCQTCMRPKDTNFDMPLEVFESIIDQLKCTAPKNRRVDYTGLGEPLLNPRLAYMVKYAKENGLQVSFTSNFTLINRNHAANLIKARLDSLFISFDGASKRTFENIRVGASFEKVVENVKLFVATRKDANSNKPKLFFMSTVSDSNVAEISQLIQLAESLGINGIEFFKQIIPDEECIRDLSISQYLKRLSKSKIEIHVVCLEKAPPFCTAVMGCYITFDGKVLPCSGLIQMVPRKRYPRFQLGDLKHNSLSDVWFSKRYRQFRTNIILGKHPFMCKSCPMFSLGEKSIVA